MVADRYGWNALRNKLTENDLFFFILSFSFPPSFHSLTSQSTEITKPFSDLP